MTYLFSGSLIELAKETTIAGFIEAIPEPTQEQGSHVILEKKRKISRKWEMFEKGNLEKDEDFRKKSEKS